MWEPCHRLVGEENGEVFKTYTFSRSGHLLREDNLNFQTYTTYDYSETSVKFIEHYSAEGVLTGRSRFLYDEEGRIALVEDQALENHPGAQWIFEFGEDANASTWTGGYPMGVSVSKGRAVFDEDHRLIRYEWDTFFDGGGDPAAAVTWPVSLRSMDYDLQGRLRRMETIAFTPPYDPAEKNARSETKYEYGQGIINSRRTSWKTENGFEELVGESDYRWTIEGCELQPGASRSAAFPTPAFP